MTTKVVPKLENRPAQPCVGIPVQASLGEWNRAIDSVPRLFAWLGENGIRHDGALFFRYRELGDSERRFDLEVGIPVPEPVEGSGEVIAGQIPGGTYATYVHHGHPDQIFQVTSDIESWAEGSGVVFDIQSREGREVWTGRFEFFLTNPEDEPDPNNWYTEVAFLTEPDAANTKGPVDE